MKKILLGAIFVSMALGAFAQNAAGRIDAGIVRNIIGKVELKPAGTSSFVPAKEGDEIAQNTIVSTGFRSSAVIAVGNAVIIARPLTLLSLADIIIVEKNENVNVNLQSGRVRIEVKPPAGTSTNFKVKTPTTTASVRGTSFEMDTRNLLVQEGVVLYSGLRGVPMVVYSGSESHVYTSSGKAEDPIIIDIQNLGAFDGDSAETGSAASTERQAEPSVTDGFGFDFE